MTKQTWTAAVAAVLFVALAAVVSLVPVPFVSWSAGGRLVIAPNTDVRVIAAASERGMVAMPGFATPTEW